jgi:hypothetical protein
VRRHDTVSSTAVRLLSAPAACSDYFSSSGLHEVILIHFRAKGCPPTFSRGPDTPVGRGLRPATCEQHHSGQPPGRLAPEGVSPDNDSLAAKQFSTMALQSGLGVPRSGLATNVRYGLTPPLTAASASPSSIHQACRVGWTSTAFPCSTARRPARAALRGENLKRTSRSRRRLFCQRARKGGVILPRLLSRPRSL